MKAVAPEPEAVAALERPPAAAEADAAAKAEADVPEGGASAQVRPQNAHTLLKNIRKYQEKV